jgi:membrane-associated protease RseP (regulator of RpoE activity)
MRPVSLAVVIVALLVASVLVHPILVVAIATRAGVAIERVGLGVGPLVAARRVLGRRVEVRALPLGSWVAFAPSASGASGSAERTSLDDAPRARRIAVALGPWLVVALVSAVLIGPTASLEAIGSGLFEVVLGGLVFWSVGVERIAAVARALALLPVTTLVGLALAKVTAWNLLPLPGLAGGMAVESIVSAKLPRPLSLVAALCGLGWAIALVMYALR